MVKIMAHLIDKDALVAEIEKLKEIYSKCLIRNNYEDWLKEGRLIGYEDALHKINTLEVKKVEESVNEDLEKVANYKFDDIEEKWRDIIDTYPDADVFIEKTWEWLKEIVAYYTENESTFEDFRKYIKGE